MRISDWSSDVCSSDLPVSDSDLAIMRRIDELHLLYPFAGSRMLRDLLRQEGTPVGRLHVAALMKRMRIDAIYRRPNTSKPAPGHKVYPYLRSEEHTSELQSLMRISYAVFCLKKKKNTHDHIYTNKTQT